MSIRWSLGRKTTVGVGAVFALFLAVAFLSYVSIEQFRDDARSVTQTQVFLGHLTHLRLVVRSAEPHLRDFEATGSDDYPALHSGLRDSVLPLISAIDTLAVYSPLQSSRTARLKTLLVDRPNLFQGNGRMLIDSIGLLIRSMEETERELFVSRSESTDRRAAQVLAILVIGTLFSVTAFAALLLILNREARRRNDSEERLAAGEQRYRQVVEAASDILYLTDRNGFFTFVNETGLRTFNYTAEEATGLHYLEIVRPDMRERVRRFYLRQAVERSHSSYFEFPALTKEGRQIYLGQNVTLLLEGPAVVGFQAVARDVTDKHFAKEKLARRENQLTSVIETVDEGITLSDERGFFEIFNPRMVELTGYTKDEANAVPDFSRVIAASPEEHRKGLDRLKDVVSLGRLRDVGTTIRSRDGTLKSVLVSTSMIRQGHREMFLSIYRDVTTEKKYLRELERATEEARSAARMKAEFLATMSHEIRTPINGVIGMTDILMHTTLTGEQHEYLDTIRTSGETLLTIINDILDFSKIESGKLVLENRPFSLVTCLEDAYDLLSFKAREKNIELLYHVEDNVPRAVVGDDIRLRQVLLNLVGNAVKFTHAGEVYTRAELTRSDGDSLDVTFTVSDTGIGMKRDVQERLFQAFMQADSSTTRKFGGTGLGLAISQRLVAMMNGSISVQSEEGGGSTFTFTVRFRKGDGQTESPEMYFAARSGPLRGKRVLIVDDNKTNLTILRHQTARYGMDPTIAESPDAALARLREGAIFEAAILDYHLPGMDGITLAQRIREYPAGRHLPMLLLSSMEPHLDLNRTRPGLFAGAALKPIKELQLLDLLSAAVTGADISPRPRKPPAPAILADRMPLSLLVAEDNAVNQKLVERMLGKLGYTAEIVSDGAEAVRAASTVRYDIIFMDVNMPELDGLEATRQIHASMPTGTRPTIIALTAGVLDEDKQKCFAAGMDDFLSKPVHMEELKSMLEKWGLGRGGRRGRGAAETSEEHEMKARLDLLVEEIDAPFVRELIDAFLPDADDKMAALNNAWNIRDFSQVRHLSHALKGSSLNLGAGHIGRLFENIQTAVDTQHPDRIPELLASLPELWRTTREGLEAFRDRIARDMGH